MKYYYAVISLGDHMVVSTHKTLTNAQLAIGRYRGLKSTNYRLGYRSVIRKINGKLVYTYKPYDPHYPMEIDVD